MYKYRMIISKCEHILHGKIIVLTAQVYNRNMFLLEKIKYLYSGIFLSTTAHNNPVHIARMHKFVKSVVGRLCQDLKNNTYPEHLSFLVTNGLLFIGLYTFHFWFYTQKFPEYFWTFKKIWITIDCSSFLFLIRFVRFKMFCIKTPFYIWSNCRLCVIYCVI